jgi:hypothetical protein
MNFSVRVEPGPYRFDIRFYKEQNLAGRLVATASVNVVIAPDGSGIPNIVPTPIPAPPIASVTVLPGQTVPVGAQQPLQLQIVDSEGNLVVPPLSSVQWNSDNTSVLSFSEGLAVGNSPGTALVTATFEGVSSAATPVSVVGSPSGGVSFAIAWGDRSGPRVAPSAALGFTLRLRRIQSDEVVLSFNGSRDQQILTELVQNYDTGIAVPEGNYRLEIDFFYNANQTGEVMGRVRTQVAIDATGAGIGTITSFVDNPIASVRIVGGESGFSIPQGQILPIGFQARNAQGQLVPLSQTDGVFRIVSGSQSIRIQFNQQFRDNELVGLAQGNAQIQATVNSVNSPIAAVQVTGQVQPGEADVRAVNLLGFDSPVAVLLNSAQITPNLPFGESTFYEVVPSGIVPLQVRRQGNPILDAVINVAPNNFYSSFLIGRTNTAFETKAITLRDDSAGQPPTQGRFVRLLHGSTQLPTTGVPFVDIFITSPTANLEDPLVQPALTGFQFGDVSTSPAYFVMQSPFRIRAVPSGARQPVLADTGASGLPATTGQVSTFSLADLNPIGFVESIERLPGRRSRELGTKVHR